MALSDKERKQVLGLLIFIGLAIPVALWLLWRAPRVEQYDVLAAERDSLQVVVDSALALIREGRDADMETRVQQFESSLTLMEQLVPLNDELPALIDDITIRANQRGVSVLRLDPQGRENRGPFEVQRYTVSVLGGYDEVGEFLSDIAALPRIMVPYDVRLQTPEAANLVLPAEVMADSSRARVVANFRIRTFVKSSADPVEGATGG